MCIERLVCTHTLPFSVSQDCPEEWHPVAMSIPSTQILVFNIILEWRETVILGETTESRTGEGNVQDKPASCKARK